jgi:acyl dehydratase
VLDPSCVGATSDPKVVRWKDRETLLYALGVGAGVDDLSLTTENSHGVEQQVLPTFAVIVCSGLSLLPRLGGVNFGSLLHGAQSVRLFRPLAPAGSMTVVAEVTALQDKGPGKNAIAELTARGTDEQTGAPIVETTTTLVLRGQGGFGGVAGEKSLPTEVPERQPDYQVLYRVTENQALIYRLSGDRNPLHSDPWFAKEKAGFPSPILHGLCTYGMAGRALVASLCAGDARRLELVSARFTAPAFPGEWLTTSIWRTAAGDAVFRVTADGAHGLGERIVLDGGRAALRD